MRTADVRNRRAIRPAMRSRVDETVRHDHERLRKSVTLAQAILESDWGRSKLTREANNLFGIKAQSGPGSAGVYEINTWEVYGGQNATVLAGFRAYTTLADSIVDHGRWFHDNSRYWGALAFKED